MEIKNKRDPNIVPRGTAELIFLNSDAWPFVHQFEKSFWEVKLYLPSTPCF